LFPVVDEAALGAGVAVAAVATTVPATPRATTKAAESATDFLVLSIDSLLIKGSRPESRPTPYRDPP
jgi:hypothetical protein